jgi:DNA-binding transcriptional regulator YbjK
MVELWAQFGSRAASALSAWITLANLEQADLLLIAKGFAAAVPPASVLSALGAATSTRSRPMNTELLRSLVADPNGHLPHPDLLTALGSHTVAVADRVDIVTSRYAAASNNHQRREVLELSSRLKPNTMAARLELIDKIILPMLSLGTTATQHVLDYARELCVPFPPKTKKRLGDAMLLATLGTSTERKARDVMQSMGYNVTKKGGFFGIGKKTHIDTGTDAE